MFIFSDSQKRWWEFLWTMTERELRSKYKFMFLGFLWLFLNPLVQMFVYGFIFQFFVPVKVENYFVFLFIGLLIWNFFSMTVSKNSTIIVNKRSLIKKANFPRESIVLSVLLSNLISFLISLIIFLLFFGTLGSFKILLTPLLLIWLLLVASGFSFLFSALNVRFRDINLIVSTILPLWFYWTPIVYTIDLLPKNLYWFFYLNPMTGIVEFSRYIFFNMPLNFLLGDIVSMLVGIVVFIAGLVIFKKMSLYFDDWI